MTYDDAGHCKPPGEAAQGAQIFAGIAFSFKGKNRLRGQAELVGYRDPDALGADIEAEVAGLSRRLQGILLPISLKPEGDARGETRRCPPRRRL